MVMVLQVPNAFCALVAAAFLAGTVVATHTDMRSPFLGGALDEATCKLALFKIDQTPGGAQ